MSNMTTTTGGVFIPEVWSKKVIAEVESKLVLANLVSRYDVDVQKDGDKIHVPSVSNLVANDKVAGVEVSPQAPTETEVEIALDQHKEASFLVEDILKVQAKHDIMGAYTGKASYAIAKAVDSSLATLGSGFSTTYGTYNTAITTDVILDSIEALDNADVPEEDRVFVFRPDVKRDLLDLSTYTSKDFVSGAPVSTGMIGDLYGVKTYMSTNIVKSGNNTNNMLFQKEALALAMQKAPRVQSEYSLADLADLVVVDAMYGVKEMRDDFGVLVKT
jgi:hypothetical protein